MSVELETFLEARGKREQLAEVRKISNMINFAYVRQGEPLGLGHAVLVARELVGNEPFAVILADKGTRCQHGVAQPERFALTDVRHAADEVGDAAYGGQEVLLAARFQK